MLYSHLPNCKYKRILICIGNITIILFSYSCNGKSQKAQSVKQEFVEHQGDSVLISKKEILENYYFIGDSLLHDFSSRIKFYFNKYKIDTCQNEMYSDSTLVKDFEGIKEIGNLNNDKIKDSVFILPPLNICEHGQSYYFSDTGIPRLLTESNCCHLKNIFLVGDIDEDGLAEIGLYFSSCVSRYKSLYVYSLKGNNWEIVGHCVVDNEYSDENTNFNNYIRKTGERKFEMLEISDMTNDKSKIGKRQWLKFEF